MLQALCLFVQDHSFEEAGQLANGKWKHKTHIKYWRLEFGSLVESEYIRHEHLRLIAFPTATRIQPSNVKSLNKEWSDRWVRSQISIKCNCAKEGELVQQKSKTNLKSSTGGKILQATIALQTVHCKLQAMHLAVVRWSLPIRRFA